MGIEMINVRAMSTEDMKIMLDVIHKLMMVHADVYKLYIDMSKVESLIEGDRTNMEELSKLDDWFCEMKVRMINELLVKL